MSGSHYRLFLLWFLGCTYSWAAPNKDIPIVFAQTLQAVEISDVLTYPARLVPLVDATVLSDSEGVVTKIKKTLGQKVFKDQEIIRIEHLDPVFEYAPVKISSPVVGIVSEIYVTQGSRVEKGQKLAKITDPSKVKIEIEVTASDLESIKSGLGGKLELATQNKIVDVEVKGVSPVANPATGTASAELKLKTPTPLTPGLVGRVSFKVNAHQGFEVPENAVVYRYDNAFLRIIEDNKAKLVPVKLGPIRKGIVEVIEGLSNNQQVVIRSNQFIADGEEVKIEESKVQSE